MQTTIVVVAVIYSLIAALFLIASWAEARNQNEPASLLILLTSACWPITFIAVGLSVARMKWLAKIKRSEALAK